MRRRGPGLIGVAARTAVVAGTATAVSGAVHNKQEAKQAAAQQQAAAQAQPVAAPVAEEPAGDPQIEKLKELGALHQQGLLTDEEFAAAKAKILGI